VRRTVELCEGNLYRWTLRSYDLKFRDLCLIMPAKVGSTLSFPRLIYSSHSVPLIRSNGKQFIAWARDVTSRWLTQLAHRPTRSTQSVVASIRSPIENRATRPSPNPNMRQPVGHYCNTRVSSTFQSRLLLRAQTWTDCCSGFTLHYCKRDGTGSDRLTWSHGNCDWRCLPHLQLELFTFNILVARVLHSQASLSQPALAHDFRLLLSRFAALQAHRTRC